MNIQSFDLQTIATVTVRKPFGISNCYPLKRSIRRPLRIESSYTQTKFSRDMTAFDSFIE